MFQFAGFRVAVPHPDAGHAALLCESPRQILLGRELRLDEQLRQIPGFSLLRRSSSLTAHPTSQGVSLRGLGPSGASRTLVLFDGAPLNDPFGGWVYWNRLPLSGLESVEVARGSLSQLYGSAAMGGAIQLLPRAPRPDTLELTARGGDHRTGDLEVFASDAATDGRWGYSLSGRLFGTDGFYVVSPENRGAVDRPAQADFGTRLGRVQWGRYHLGVNSFREERENGTALQTNDTRLQSLQAGWTGEVAHAAVLCPSFYRADVIINPTRFDQWLSRMRGNVIGYLQRRRAAKRIAFA